MVETHHRTECSHAKRNQSAPQATEGDLVETCREMAEHIRSGKTFSSPDVANLIERLASGIEALERQALHYQNIAGEQGTKLLRLGLALKVARAWGIHSHGYHAGVSYELAQWVDAGASAPLPFVQGAFFERWAEENGLSNCDGILGYKMTVALMPETTLND